MQRVVLKFRKDGGQWACDQNALYHLEALISLWLYSFIFRRQQDEIKYNEDLPTFGTYVSWHFPENKVLSDFLTIIGHNKHKETLIRLLDMGKLSTQNIVQIVPKYAISNAKEIPRSYIPIFLDADPSAEGEETRDPVFIPLEHLFGEEYDDYGHESDSQSTQDHSGPLFAYKYLASPSIYLLENRLI